MHSQFKCILKNWFNSLANFVFNKFTSYCHSQGRKTKINALKKKIPAYIYTELIKIINLPDIYPPPPQTN